MNDLVKVLFSTIALFVILIVQQSYETVWFDDSLTIIPRLQDGASDFAKSAWHTYSNLGLAAISALPILIPYIDVTQRAKAFYYLTLVLGATIVMSLQKLNYHQARPFWVSEEIWAGDCTTEYGNPSGHCLMSLGISLSVFLDYNCWACAESKKENPSCNSKWYMRLLYATLVVVFSGTIAYSRMFLGVHSLNQVVFGLSMGLWIALTVHFIFKEQLLCLTQKLIDCQEEQSLKSMALIALGLFVSVFAIQIINYQVVLPFENPESWSVMITEKCGADSLKGAYQEKGLTEYGMVALIWGAFYGILLQRKYAPGVISGELAEEPWWHKYARLGVAVLTALPGAAITLILMKVGVDNVYSQMVFMEIIPTILIGLGLFYGTDVISRKWGILNMKDISVEGAETCLTQDTEQLSENTGKGTFYDKVEKSSF